MLAVFIACVMISLISTVIITLLLLLIILLFLALWQDSSRHKEDKSSRNSVSFSTD